MKKTNINLSGSRRNFLGNTAIVAAGITIVPSHVVSGLGHKPPSDKLNIAGIGVGGKGFGNLRELESENIVALCDVDWDYAKRTFDYFPKAKKFKDWRHLYDDFKNSFDAVMVATTDHTHAIISAHAITLGKHIYCEKPLTHSVYESRLLTKLAANYNVATQMGNQGASGEGVNQIVEWLLNDEIGEVTKVEAFTDRPTWGQGLNTPEKGQWVPETLDWDLFIGPANMRPYNQLYHPWNWRGWWDYGTGALGDMACHILHPIFAGLELGFPSHANASSTLLMQDSAPNAQSVTITFPSRPSKLNLANNKKNLQLPEVEVLWYDGGIKPKLPKGWPPGKNLLERGGGVIFHGERDKIICGCYGLNPWLLSGRQPSVPQFCRRIENSHHVDWVRACKESTDNRIPCSSDFSVAGPFNEMVLMGVLAVRLQGLNKTLNWDGQNMIFTNLSENDTFSTVIKDELDIINGRVRSNKTWTEPIPAKMFSSELIKHTYRNPWSLPDMPK